MSEVLVTVAPHGWEFEVKEGEMILDAALRQGVALRYGCRHGNCSTCKYLVEDGEVDVGRASPYSLPERERAEGFALLCCAQPLTDLDILDDAEIDDRQQPILPISESTAFVREVVQLSPQLWSLTVHTEEPIRFYAGQFVELEAPGHNGEWRSYSIASPPDGSNQLTFVIKRIPDGLFSGRVEALEIGSTVRIRGPYGASYLREGQRPVVLVATGSGIAPILAILQDAAMRADDRDFTLYYGARTRADLVQVDLLDELTDKLRLRVVHSLSQPTTACDWSDGLTGRVTKAVQADLRDAAEYDAYLCGKPEMCDTIGILLEAKGIAPSRIFYDKFFAAS